MAIIEQRDHTVRRSTQATLFSGATSALFLVASGGAVTRFLHALSAAGSLAHLGAEEWLSPVIAAGCLWMSLRNARHSWRGEWPDIATHDVDDPILEPEDEDGEPVDEQLEYLGRVAAFYDPGDDVKSAPITASDDDANDKKLDVDSSS